MSKKAKVNRSGMSDSAKAEWRASKSAQLSGRLAAMKKVADMPDPKARAPKRSYAAPADAAAQPANPTNVPASDATGANVGEPVANGENAHNPPAGEEVVREHTNRKGPQGKKEKQPKESKRAPKAVKEPKPRAEGCSLPTMRAFPSQSISQTLLWLWSLSCSGWLPCTQPIMHGS